MDVSVAQVIDGVENAQLAGWANGKPAVIVNVQRQPGANVIQVADRVKELLPRLKSSLPQGLDVAVLSDRTRLEVSHEAEMSDACRRDHRSAELQCRRPAG